MTFKSGQSGNPGGRPLRGLSITQHLEDLVHLSDGKFRELLDYLERKEKSRGLGKVTMGRLLASRILLLATEGNLEAAKIVLERVDGKVESTGSLAPLPVINIQTNVLVAGGEKEDTVLSEGKLEELDNS